MRKRERFCTTLRVHIRDRTFYWEAQWGRISRPHFYLVEIINESLNKKSSLSIVRHYSRTPKMKTFLFGGLDMTKPCVNGKNIKISRVFSRIVRRLPSTYPKALLVIHPSLRKLESYFWETGGTALDPGDPGHPPFAYCDGEDNSIHVASILNKDSARQISWYLLHEIGHLQALRRYGDYDSRWDDYRTAERYANRFANRWCNKLKEEGFFKTI